MEPGEVPELTSDLDCWKIKLKTGETVTVKAHAMKETDQAYVFIGLMKGSPAFEYELARFPATAVDGVEGGWPMPRA